MTTTVRPTPAPPGPDMVGTDALGTDTLGTDRLGTDVAERGRTTIAERAVARLAAHAVTEVDGVGGSARRVLGVEVGGDDPGRAATVTARVSGDRAALDVQLSVAYPASVGRTTEAARTHLTGRVEHLTGLAVTRVDITVTSLHGAAVRTGRVS